MSVVRVREHVNPLSDKYQIPIVPPDWAQIYPDLNQPLHLDIGCGKGRFLLNLAALQPDWNFLGLEIREPLVEQANDWRTEQELTNLHYLFCNANISLQPLLDSLPSACLKRVTIQFPDPWFKRRHQKRRVVQSDVVEVLSRYLVEGGEVVIQSDIWEVAAEMHDRFLSHPQFICPEGWLTENPLPVSTEREISTLKRGEPVYRSRLIRQG